MISLLYVDDEPSLLDVCRLFLEQEGDISVVTVASAKEALICIGSRKFDAIISDYQMPEIDGLAFLRAVRQQHPDMPFILFTGRGREEVVIEAINNGVDSYVQKGGDLRAQFKELSHLLRQIVRRRKAETELRLMKFSVDHASEGILWMRVDGDITYYNETICTMLGYTPKEFSTLSAKDLRPGISHSSVSSRWSSLLTQKCAIVEEMLIRKDGSSLPVELVLNYNEQGPESLIFAFVRDISERRHAEGKLKKALHQLIEMEEGLHRQFEEFKKSDSAMQEIAQRYQLLFSETKEWVWEIDSCACITRSSPRVKEILGYEPAELEGKRFSDFLAPASRIRAEAAIREILSKKVAFQGVLLQLLNREGREVVLELSGIPVHSREGSLTGFYGIAHDISAKTLPAGIQPSGYSSLLEQAGDAIFVSDAETGMLMDANRKALQLVGRTLPELCTMRESSLSFPIGEDGKAKDTDLPISEEESGTAERIITDRDGNQIPVVVCTKMLRVGERLLRIAIYHDISDLRAIEETLREKTGELDQFFTAGSDLLCILDPTGRIQRLNPAGEAMLGHGAHTEQDLSLLTMVHPGDRAATRSILRRLGKDGAAVTFINRIISPDGSFRWLEWRAFMSGRKRIYAVARDLTEQKCAEQALALANRKLNLLADLTRHDIKNKMTVLVGYLDLFRGCTGEPHFSMYTEKINETISALSAQVEFIRIYQNLGISAPRWFNIDSRFQEACRQQEIPSGAVISPQDGWEICADPLIDRVFATLVDNAIRYGTTLTEIRRTAFETPDGLTIVIEDNGVGIAQDKKERIFEKGIGKASGYSHSLFLAREILSITGISLSETGRAGKGARFEIKVPKGMYRFNVPEPEKPGRPGFAPDFITPPHHNLPS